MWTAQDEARLQEINSQLGSSPAPSSDSGYHGLARWGMNASRAAEGAFLGVLNTPMDIANLFASPDAQLPTFQNTVDPVEDMGPAKGFSDQAADFAGGVGSSILQFLATKKLLSPLGKVASSGPAVGFAMGSPDGLGNAVLSAAEFGGMEAASGLPRLMRMAANTAIPVAGQLIRGEDPTSTQGLVGTAAQVALGELGGRTTARPPQPNSNAADLINEAVARRPLFRRAVSPEPVPIDPEVEYNPPPPYASSPLSTTEPSGLQSAKAIETPPEARSVVEPRSKDWDAYVNEGLNPDDALMLKAEELEGKLQDLAGPAGGGVVESLQLGQLKGSYSFPQYVEKLQEAFDKLSKSGPPKRLFRRRSASESGAVGGTGFRPLSDYEQYHAGESRIMAMIQDGSAFEPNGEMVPELQALLKEKEVIKNRHGGMPPKNPAESGAMPFPLVAHLGSGAAGAIGGYASAPSGATDEERRNRAILGFGASLLAPSVIRKGIPLLKRLEEKTLPEGVLSRDQAQAKANETGVTQRASSESGAVGGAGFRKLFPKTEAKLEQKAANIEAVNPLEPADATGKAVRFLEANMGISRSNELFRAIEKGKGKENSLRRQVDETAPAFLKVSKDLTPSELKAGSDFLNSPGKPADVAKLASVRPEYADFLRTAKAVTIEGQRTAIRGESDIKKRALIAGSVGQYWTRAFRAIVDPKEHKFDPATFQKVSEQWAQNPEFRGVEESTVQAILGQHLAELGKSGEAGLFTPTNPRISRTLYMHRKDFSPADWSFLEGMSTDPSVNPSMRKAIADMVSSKTVDMGDQAIIGMLAKDKNVHPNDAARLKEIAGKEVLTPEYRSLLGEITDPLERQLYTVNKLVSSVKAAETFNQLAQTTFEDGRNMVYSMKEWDTAKQIAPPEVRKELDGYLRLPDNPSLGKLSGKMVPRDAADMLGTLIDPVKSGQAWRLMSTVNSWMKEAVTVGNTATHVRQWAQIPFFLQAAGVNIFNPADYKYLGDAIRVMREPRSALHKEILENHVSGANFAKNDILDLAEQAISGKKPNLFRRIRQKARDLYGIPDDFVRVTSYLKQKDLGLSEATKRGMSGDAANQFAVNKAMDWLRDYTMNYSETPRAINAMKHIPVVSPFIGYSSEMVRMTKNLVRDMATGSGQGRVRAAMALASLYALPGAASIAAKNMLPTKDREDWDKIQGLLPTYQRNAFVVPIGRKADGTFKTFNLNPWMPAADLASILASVGRGDIDAVLSENPVVGFHKSPSASAFADIASEENYFTHEKLDTPGKKLGRAAETLTPPILGFQGKRLLQAFTPNAEGGFGIENQRTGNEVTPTTAISGLFGVGLGSVKPTALFRRANAGLREKLDDARSELRKILATNAAPEVRQKAILKFQKAQKDVEDERLKTMTLFRQP